MMQSLNKTTFLIKKMDCPSEEQMIRMKLEEFANIESLQFDIPGRRLDVCHTDGHDSIFTALDSLGLDTRFVSSEQVTSSAAREVRRLERRVLLQVLGINAFFFVLEMLTGFIAGSMGLVADSLDMLADSIVYSLSLFAVGGTVLRKKRIAGAAGTFQLILGLLGFAEVVRRFLGYGDMPDFHLMILISLLALAGNATCLYLLNRSKSKEAHMQASMIFTSTDVIVNAGVIAAGVMVYLTKSNLPDLLIGTIVFTLVLNGAYRIMKLSK
jgi:Co/Zn/Cd efflux system component